MFGRAVYMLKHSQNSQKYTDICTDAHSHSSDFQALVLFQFLQIHQSPAVRCCHFFLPASLLFPFCPPASPTFLSSYPFITLLSCFSLPHPPTLCHSFLLSSPLLSAISHFSVSSSIPSWPRYRDIPDLDLSLLQSCHCNSSSTSLTMSPIESVTGCLTAAFLQARGPLRLICSTSTFVLNGTHRLVTKDLCDVYTHSSMIAEPGNP